MKLVILSGRSGSGKSTALQQLEDLGFYCIDNLPASLLPDLIQRIKAADEQENLAVGIDARNTTLDLKNFTNIIAKISELEIETTIVYLDAASTTILKRFSATRRKHPLSNESRSLDEAIIEEKLLLEDIASNADIKIDTSHLTIYELRDQIKQRVAQKHDGNLAVLLQSFGFKHGVPRDSDFVFDVRHLPNPFWEKSLRSYTGKEQPIIEFLEGYDSVGEMKAHILSFLERWLPDYEKSSRNYLTVSIGCTGGQHRSVYLVEQLFAALSESNTDHIVQKRHRELNQD